MLLLPDILSANVMPSDPLVCLCPCLAVALPFDKVDVTDSMEATALTHALTDVDIYSNSWGPPEGITTIGKVGPLAMAALNRGIHEVSEDTLSILEKLFHFFIPRV